MNKLAILLIFSALLIFGCTEEQKKPVPSATKGPLVQIPEVSSTPTPTPTPTPLGIVSSPKVLIGNLTAVISWDTNFPSNSIIEFGLDPKYGNIKNENSNSTNHRLNLTDLKFITAYQFRAISCRGDECVKTSNFNFTTGHKKCPDGMSYISDGDFCIDNYEATIVDHVATVRADAIPTNPVPRQTAISACQNASKRLCTSAEFGAACDINGSKTGRIGEKECNVGSDTLMRTGVSTDCISDKGVHDLIGNVWEWVSDGITDNTPNRDGLVTRSDILSAGKNYNFPTTSSLSEKWGNDYYSNIESDPSKFLSRGIVRGGFYNSGWRAGCNAYMVGVPLDAVSNVGFRCCQ
jgi:hypothetical protein